MSTIQTGTRLSINLGLGAGQQTVDAGQAQKALNTLNGLGNDPFAGLPVPANPNPYAGGMVSDANPFSGGMVSDADPFAGGMVSTVDPYAKPPTTPAATLPKPSIDLSSAPAGEGLKTAGGKWPKGSIRTSGGYTIVPDGKTKWEIFGPKQGPKDKALSTISGDPHVYDKNGKKVFDFSKSSDFLLPDGTRIACKTSAETGHSVSTGLDICCGMDHVSITHLDGKPTVGKIDHNGLEWRESHLAQNKKLETFEMGGSAKNLKWFKDVGGVDKGLITGAKYDGKSYHQTVDGSKKYVVDPSLKPPLGSVAYGNMLRSQLDDQIGNMAQKGTFEPLCRLLSNVLHFEGAFSEIKHGVSEAIDGVKDAFGGIKEVGGAFGELFHGLGGLFSNPFGGLVDLFGAFKDGVQGVKDVISGGKELIGGVKDGWHGVQDGIAAVGQLGDTAKDFFDTLLGIKHKQLAAW